MSLVSSPPNLAISTISLGWRTRRLFPPIVCLGAPVSYRTRESGLPHKCNVLRAPLYLLFHDSVVIDALMKAYKDGNDVITMCVFSLHYTARDSLTDHYHRSLGAPSG
jgi:hypothetical protein